MEIKNKQVNVTAKKMTTSGYLRIWRLIILDYVFKYTPSIVSALLVMRASFYRLTAYKINELTDLMRAHRIAPSQYVSKRVKCNLDKILQHKVSLVSPIPRCDLVSRRIIILKKPHYYDGHIEKGIILYAFTETFSYCLLCLDLKSLTTYFHIVLEPSWAGYCDANILAWSECSSTVIVQATEKRDRKFLNFIDNNLRPVSFGASDWVNYEIFKPLSLEKTYDVVYVANYNPVKRIHKYLEAIKSLLGKGIKVRGALVCSRWGESRSALLDMINFYSLTDTVDLYEGLSKEEVNYVLNLSKCNILLSLKEGSNRALFEGLFAGTPAILLRNNVGVNKDYINPSTGLLIDESQIADAIVYLTKHWQSFEPHEWAIKNISPEETTKKLVEAINGSSPSSNVNTNQVAIKVNQPEVDYLDFNIDKEMLANCNKKILELFKNQNQKELSTNHYIQKINSILTDHKIDI